MAHIVFYEKPGCAGNARQKALLHAAGHTLDVRDLLATPWTAETLRPFFGTTPVADWFNRAAPAIKNGSVDPDNLDDAAALALMVAQPILIRRPLMQVGDVRHSGFDTGAVDQWIGLEAGADAGNVEGCARSDRLPCPAPSAKPNQ